MKRQTENTSGTTKLTAAPETQSGTNTPWVKTPKRLDSPAPPPVWTRYIDSRLKQFCVR